MRELNVKGPVDGYEASIKCLHARLHLYEEVNRKITSQLNRQKVLDRQCVGNPSTVATLHLRGINPRRMCVHACVGCLIHTHIQGCVFHGVCVYNLPDA